MGRAWVFGDVYKYSDDSNTDAVVAMIAGKWQAGDIVVMAGDCLQEDPPTTTKYNAMIVAVFDALGIDETNRTQVLAVPGNHDYDRSAFNTAFGVTGNIWSTHVIGGARWILLDSMNASVDVYNPGVDSAQLTWLDSVLAAPFAGPTYAVMHHPRKSSYTQTSPDSYNNNTVLDSLYSRLYGAEVDYVFHGHVPFFEITKKIDHLWYPRTDGFRQIGTGTGGWSHAGSGSSNQSYMAASDASGTVVIGNQFNDSAGGAYGATLATWDSTVTTIEYFSTDGVARYTLTNDPINSTVTGVGDAVRWTELEYDSSFVYLGDGSGDGKVPFYVNLNSTWQTGDLVVFNPHANGNTYRFNGTDFADTGTLGGVWCHGPTGALTYSGIVSVVQPASDGAEAWAFVHQEQGDIATIGVIQSTDAGLGYTWGTPATIVSGVNLETSGFRGATSPSVMWDGTQYVMYYTNRHGTGVWHGIHRARCATPNGTWTLDGLIVHDTGDPHYYSEGPAVVWSVPEQMYLMTYNTDKEVRVRRSSSLLGPWSSPSTIIAKEQQFSQTTGYRRWYGSLVDETQAHSNIIGTTGYLYEHFINAADSSDRWPALSAMALDSIPNEQGGAAVATALGIASATGSTGVTIDTSGIKGTDRYGLLALAWNGPSHNGGIVGMPTIPAGWTLVEAGAGVGYTPGVGVWWGPLETVDSVVVTSSPATVHMSGSVVAFDAMATPASTVRASGYATSAGGTFPDVTGGGGWLALCGINNNTYTASFDIAHQQTYESPQYSGATIFAGSIPTGGWTSQAGTFTLSNLDNYATLFVSFANPTETVYTWTDVSDVVVTGTVVGTGVGTDVTSTDINGVDNLQGQPVTYDDRWDVSPSVPSSTTWPFRVTLPAGYPADAGYHAYIRMYDDATDTAIGPEVTCTNQSGDLGIVGGETAAVFSPTVTATTGGATTVYARIRLVPDTAANIRAAGGGGVAGRLARPRMVELWRSQGETTPTLTTPNRWVDPINGSDSNNGLSSGAAWRTMSHVFTQTSGLGVGIGYMSGNLGYFARDGGAGNGTSWTTGMNTHYVLAGHTCTVNGAFWNDSAIHIKHMSYLQFSGFDNVEHKQPVTAASTTPAPSKSTTSQTRTPHTTSFGPT